jgi:hypothetical protein
MPHLNVPQRATAGRSVSTRVVASNPSNSQPHCPTIGAPFPPLKTEPPRLSATLVWQEQCSQNKLYVDMKPRTCTSKYPAGKCYLSTDSQVPCPRLPRSTCAASSTLCPCGQHCTDLHLSRHQLLPHTFHPHHQAPAPSPHLPSSIAADSSTRSGSNRAVSLTAPPSGTLKTEGRSSTLWLQWP